MSPEARNRVFEQLKIDEGVVYEIYLDHLGYPTLGVGHLILEGDLEHGQNVGTKVSEERVKTLFTLDLNTAISECEVLYDDCWDKFPEEVQEILVNMLFNMGRPRLSKFKKMNAALREGDWKTASVEGQDSLWYRQVGNRANRLMSRLESIE
jgi:lysozyme